MKKLSLLFPLIPILLTSCKDGKPTITFVVESAAPYYTSKDTLYVAGNFNDWNPKDPNTKLKRLSGNRFGAEIVMPPSFTDLNY